MAVITEDAIRELASFRGEAAPVLSCYLDVDGRRVRHADYEHELDHLLREAASRANGEGRLLRPDVERIAAYVRNGFDRSRTRGLAIFSCAAHDLWEVVALPVAVTNRVVVSETPAVSQLELLVQDLDRFGVLLADRQRARMFVFELGELTDRSELFEELPRDYDAKGERDQGDHQAHVDALASQHLRHAAAVAFLVFQEQGFEHLTIGAPDSIGNELESYLHPYLKDRLVGRLGVPPTAGLEAIRQAAVAVELDYDRHQEAVVVGRLRDAVGIGSRGVVGLTDTLAALQAHRVQTLVVSTGYTERGWSCPSCGVLVATAPLGRVCGECRTELHPVDDVVEAALGRALSQACGVQLCVGNADLDVMGRIGGLLRY